MSEKAAKDRPLDSGIEAALRGEDQPLYDFLRRISGLPGERINAPMMEAFGEACAARGKAVDALLLRMASIHPDDAPGGTASEILPVAAAYGIGARAAADDRTRTKMLALLHEQAEDMRFRVRDAVAQALASLGARVGTKLLFEVESFMDGFFHAAAVMRAVCMNSWLSTIDDAALLVDRYTQSFALLADATRSSRRYPGHKALVDALVAAPRMLAPKCGALLFERMADLATTKDPDLAALIKDSIKDSSLRSRFADEIATVNRQLADHAPVPRDPTRIVQGTRGRGRRRR